MKLYLMRHGHANQTSSLTTSNSERSLSDEGQNDAAVVGRLLSQLDPSLRQIITSSLKRAVETGDIIASQLGSDPSTRVSENLNPGFRQPSLLTELASFDQQSILAIGHQPDMSSLISSMISDSGSAVEMTTGAIACVEFPPGSPKTARLLWLLTPQILHQNSEKRKERTSGSFSDTNRKT